MLYVITFLEGVFSFISPCILPLIPVYVAYFEGDIAKKNKTIINSLGFVLGFTSVFCLLGVFASSIGVFLKHYEREFNLISGIIVILFGLEYLNVIKFNIFKGKKIVGHKINGLFSAIIFGIVSAINFTPCIGSLLGSALMMASTTGTILKGMILLFCYSIGLGLPIVISTMIITKLNAFFKFIKNNYKVINVICGIFLLLVGMYIILNGQVTKNVVINNNIEENGNYGDLGNFEFYDINGDLVNISDFYGKPIVLNFWASWCLPCKSELPSFNRIYEENKNEISFIMINLASGYGENIQNIKKFIEENNYDFPVYFDLEGKVTNYFGITSIPKTFFIDKNGKIINSFLGAMDYNIILQNIQMIK